MTKIYTSIILLFLANIAIAQTALVKGTVLSISNSKPLEEASITIIKAKVATSTNASGEFTVSNIPFGVYQLVISADGYADKTQEITVNEKVTNIGNISLDNSTTSIGNPLEAQSFTSMQDAADKDGETASAQNVGSALSSGRDPFNNAASYNWGGYFFKPRGYENEHSTMYINGIPMNDLDDGSAGYNNITGLNDVLRTKTSTYGLAPNETNYGGLGTTTSFDASASTQRKQTRVTLSNTNRSGYRNRVMLTSSTGIMKNGWSFSGSVSKRWAEKAAIPGTYYDGFSYYGAAEKKIHNHSISLTAIGAPLKRAKGGTAMQEVFDLSGNHLYSPNWGYQAGNIRSSKVLTQNNPMFILSDEINMKNSGKLTASASYHFGETSTTTLDWYNSADPRPDYYRYLPSYATVEFSDAAGLAVQQELQANPDKLQINWDNMYQANHFGRNNLAGISGNRSDYILGADVEKQKKLNFALNYQQVMNSHITIYAGANAQNLKSENFRRVEDLLGGDYWYNVNQFAERTFAGISGGGDNNLLETNKAKKVGDTYGYDYKMNFMKVQTWGQAIATYNKFDYFLAVNATNTQFQREGLYKVGVYQNNSYGKSVKQDYLTYGIKGGLTYKINGRNYLYANASQGTNAPLYDNVFVSPRTRNEVSSINLLEKMQSVEAGYMLRTPSVKARLTFFDTEIKDANDIKRYFDMVSASFANVTISNINKRYTGVELGAEFKVSPTLGITTALNLMQSFYTNRPKVNTYIDNDTSGSLSNVFGNGDSIFSKNLSLPNGPQTAASLGFVYRSPKYWMFTMTGNYLADNYIDFAPNKHTTYGIDLMQYTVGSAEYNKFVTQQKLPNFFTLNASFNKSWKANKIMKNLNPRNMIGLTISGNNILNNKDIKLLGFEQLRSDITRPSLFDTKYSYAQGATYFVNFTYTF